MLSCLQKCNKLNKSHLVGKLLKFTGGHGAISHWTGRLRNTTVRSTNWHLLLILTTPVFKQLNIPLFLSSANAFFFQHFFAYLFHYSLSSFLYSSSFLSIIFPFMSSFPHTQVSPYLFISCFLFASLIPFLHLLLVSFLPHLLVLICSLIHSLYLFNLFIYSISLVPVFVSRS